MPRPSYIVPCYECNERFDHRNHDPDYPGTHQYKPIKYDKRRRAKAGAIFDWASYLANHHPKYKDKTRFIDGFGGAVAAYLNRAFQHGRQYGHIEIMKSMVKTLNEQIKIEEAEFKEVEKKRK